MINNQQFFKKGLKAIYYGLWRNIIYCISKVALYTRETTGLRGRRASI